jgi:hypothetical protein
MSPLKCIIKIENMLLKIGASNICKHYNHSLCTGMTFQIYDPALKQYYVFLLKAPVEEYFEILWSSVKKPKDYTQALVEQQASRTAWNIVLNWTDTQCTMILLSHARPLEVFLPYLFHTDTKETLITKIYNGKVKLLV